MNKSLFLAAAIAGLVATSATHADAKAEKKGTVATGECHGANSCKGKGECGGEGHACAGKNDCKGKGWVKATEAKCKKLGGNFVASKM